MEKASRQEQVLGFLRGQTSVLLQTQGEHCAGISAEQVAAALGYDRANVSKELNALHRQGQLVKRQGKPTFFTTAVRWKSSGRGSFSLQAC